MNDLLSKQLKLVRDKFNEVKKSTESKRIELKGKIERLTKGTSKYHDAWVGEWFTDDYNLYLKDFDPNSKVEMNVDMDYILRDLKKATDVDLELLRKEIPALSKKFFELKDFIATELSFVKGNVEFQQANEFLTQIDNFVWGIKPDEYLKSQQPKYAYVTDPSILQRGIDKPPHLLVGNDIIFTFSLLVSYDNFEILANKLIRNLEFKLESLAGEISAEIGDAAAQLGNLIDKFHAVATQLKNRHSGRETLVIKDEYDVQDLMNSMLRIHFEDVRKEEYSPSYAGGSSRIDFLLKREKVLIEIKKTRDNLKDRQIGEELIIDIAHYKSHPDCKALTCFVYDPDNKIGNPRGLEDDLNKMTSDQMAVTVYIRP